MAQAEEEPKGGGPPTTALLMRGAGTSNLKEAITMDLHNVGIDTIESLELCPKLRSLDMSFNKIKEMKNLESLTELRELKLYDNNILYVKNLLQLTALQSLDLSGNRVENVEGVSHLKQLTTLRLRHNRIAELAGFGKMSGLEILDVSHNKIQEMEGLQGCTALKELVLHGNKISSISGLSRLSRLTELGLNGNRLASLHGVKEVASTLDILWVAENQLESLRGIPDCLPKLSELYIADNKLTTLQPLDKCCPSLELLDAARNKLASVKRLQVALGPLDDLAELKAEGNPICHQPDGQPTYRERVVAALPRLRYLDEEEISEPERAWAASGGSAAAAAAGGDPELMPTAEEMEEFKRRMGIRSDVPAMGSPVSSRPSSSGAGGNRPSSAMRRSVSFGNRPSTPSDALPQGTAPVGPMGRPSTPRSQGQPVLDARAIGNPVMTQRPPSARTGLQGGAAVMKPEQYEESLVDFTNTMNQYQMQMQDIMRKMREGLAMDLPQATAAVRANGMRGPQDGVTAALPRLPQLPTFATKSDTDAALKKEARMQAAAKQPAGGPGKKAGAAGSASGRGSSAPRTPERAGRPPQRAPMPPQAQPAPAASAGPPSIPGVRDSVAAMPTKANELLEYYNKLFPSAEPEAEEAEEPVSVEQHQDAPHQQRLAEQGSSASEPQPQPAAPPASVTWTRPGGGPGYAAAGGFKRVNMDDLGDEAAGPSAVRGLGPPDPAPRPQRFARVDMDDVDDAGVYSTASAGGPPAGRGAAAAPRADREQRRGPPSRAQQGPDSSGPEAAAAEQRPGVSSSRDLMAKLEMLEQMVSDYGSAAAKEASDDALMLAAADEALYKEYRMQQLDEQTRMILEGSAASGAGLGLGEGNEGKGAAVGMAADLYDDAGENHDILFHDVQSTSAAGGGGGAKYSSFRLPNRGRGGSKAAAAAEATSPESSRPSTRGSIGSRLGKQSGAGGGKAAAGGTGGSSSQVGKAARPLSASKKLGHRAPGGMLSKNR